MRSFHSCIKKKNKILFSTNAKIEHLVTDLKKISGKQFQKAVFKILMTIG